MEIPQNERMKRQLIRREMANAEIIKKLDVKGLRVEESMFFLGTSTEPVVVRNLGTICFRESFVVKYGLACKIAGFSD